MCDFNLILINLGIKVTKVCDLHVGINILNRSSKYRTFYMKNYSKPEKCKGW